MFRQYAFLFTLLIVTFFGFAWNVLAFSDNFDTATSGSNIAGTNGWTSVGGSNLVATTSQFVSSPNSAAAATVGSNLTIKQTSIVATTSTGSTTVRLRAQSTSNDGAVDGLLLSASSSFAGAGTCLYISAFLLESNISTSGGCGSGGTHVLQNPITAGTWYYLEIDWRTTSGHLDFRYVTTATTTGWYTSTILASSTLYFGLIEGRSATHPKWFDDFTVTAGVPSGGGGGDPCVTGSTRVCDLTPADGSTVTGPSITFNFDYFISPDDIGGTLGTLGVRVLLHNIDQNYVYLPGFLNSSDIYFIDAAATSSGTFTFASTTPLPDGNYRIEACLTKTYGIFGIGIIENNFTGETCVNNQFVVGTSTYIGAISQRIWDETNDYLSSSTASTSAGTAQNCNPLSVTNFNVLRCLAFLFVPDSYYLKRTMDDAKSGILTRFPIGYLTRFIAILTNTTAGTLPTFTAHVQMGPGDSTTPEVAAFTFDMGDIVSGASTLVNSIQDPINHMTLRQILEPYVQLGIALGVLLTIIADIIGTAKSSRRNQNVKK